MDTTSTTLLHRLRSPLDQKAWQRFVRLYTPLIYRWGRRSGMSADEATDLVQDVFALLIEKLPDFQYDRQKSFRAWLRKVTLNKWRERLRRRRNEPTALGNVEGHASTIPDHSNDFDEAEYRTYLVHRAMKLLEADFQPTTWKACWEYVALARPAGEVAAELGLSVNAVYLAKARVLRRLRSELEGLLDE